MCEVAYSPTQLALEIDFEGRIEAVLRRHTSLICWNKPGMSPVADRGDNGTCCFVQTEKLRCVATCAHVWDGFSQDAINKGAGILWLSLINSEESSAPIWAYEVPRPILISKDTNLDLATFTFEGINALEPWRFYRIRHTARERASNGEFVFFLGCIGDGVRKASATWKLDFTRFNLPVADVGHFQFLLHDRPGERNWIDGSGKETQPQRIPGVSGAAVFRLGNLGPGPLHLPLVGFVSRLSSPGLTNSPSEPVGVNSDQRYEMSDGDIYVTHSRFIHPDGSIHE